MNALGDMFQSQGKRKNKDSIGTEFGACFHIIDHRYGRFPFPCHSVISYWLNMILVIG